MEGNCRPGWCLRNYRQKCHDSLIRILYKVLDPFFSAWGLLNILGFISTNKVWELSLLKWKVFKAKNMTLLSNFVTVVTLSFLNSFIKAFSQSQVCPKSFINWRKQALGFSLKFRGSIFQEHQLSFESYAVSHIPDYSTKYSNLVPCYWKLCMP